MGIINILSLFILLFVTLNLALHIYNKFNHKLREGITGNVIPDPLCNTQPQKPIPRTFSLNPSDIKNTNYIDNTQFGGEADERLPWPGSEDTIGDFIYTPKTCRDYKNHLDTTDGKRQWSFTNEIGEIKQIPQTTRLAYKQGCDIELCKKITSDINIKNFGINQKQIDDRKELNKILEKINSDNINDKIPSLNKNAGINTSILWKINNSDGNFKLHDDDIMTEWQPRPDEKVDNFFSQKVGIVDNKQGFTGIKSTKKNLVAWSKNDKTNILDDSSKLFTCKKPCDGSNNYFIYDDKTKLGNVDFKIQDVAADQDYIWMINKVDRERNDLYKKPNFDIPFIDIDGSRNLECLFKNNDKTIRKKLVIFIGN